MNKAIRPQLAASSIIYHSSTTQGAGQHIMMAMMDCASRRYTVLYSTLVQGIIVITALRQRRLCSIIMTAGHNAAWNGRWQETAAVPIKAVVITCCAAVTDIIITISCHVMSHHHHHSRHYRFIIIITLFVIVITLFFFFIIIRPEKA